MSLNSEEIARFSALSGGWWDENGPFKPLHHLNPTRLTYLIRHLSQHFGTLQGISVLDIGCGGGLVAEPLTRLGASVTGIDGSEKTIEVAKAHARLMNLDIAYTCTSAESLAATGQQYDGVLALELVEHVDDVPHFIKTCYQLTKPGGLIIFSTLNRTLKSYVVAILGAEYFLRWLPVGTHTWQKFRSPGELGSSMREAGFTLQDITGLSFNPLSWSWFLSKDLDVNYFVMGVRKYTQLR
jgi:2-polyprenyl-6-hydroxyphenyl methylase / 3-demethylubiquinone-9 3-methyltransferase